MTKISKLKDNLNLNLNLITLYTEVIKTEAINDKDFQIER